jgi:hypothetical protein
MAKKQPYKYYITPTVFGVDFWDKNGRIALCPEITQKQLEYLYSIEYRGVIRKDENGNSDN